MFGAVSGFSVREIVGFWVREEGAATEHVLSSRPLEASIVISPQHALQVRSTSRRGNLFSKQAAVRRRQAAQPTNILFSVVVDREAEDSSTTLRHFNYAPQIFRSKKLVGPAVISCLKCTS